MEDTQDIRGKRSCRNATNNYLTRWYRKVSTNNQPSCNAIHESKWEHKVAENYKLIFSVLQVQALAIWLSYKERRVDALALRAEERRDKLR